MAEALLGEHERFICAICLDLLKDPVTIPCGHSYCMTCIDECWNKDDHSGVYSCPQCRQTFNSRPSLNRSTVLAEIMEKLRDTSHAQSLAGPEDIACDFCPERKFKAVKSCLECQCSYCEEHLHPHYNVPALKKHRLVKAAVMLSYTCSKHDKLLEVYCRTDNKCVCTHCLMDDHKAHDTVPSAVERKEKQEKLTDNQKKVKQTIQEKEKELGKMTADIMAHSHSAKKAMEDSKSVFTELIHLIEMRSTEVIEKIKAHEKADLDQGADLQEKLVIDISELQRRDGLLQTLLQTEDNIHFFQNFESVSSSSECQDFPSVSFKPSCCYIDVSKLVCELKERMETVFNEEISKTLQKVSDLTIKKTPVCIKIGDKVRVKASVQAPEHYWGNVTHKSVGVVQDIKDDENLVINFPGHKHWKGILSEIELVINDNHSRFKVGSRVCVKASVETPKYGWGHVTKNSVGIVKAVDGDELAVDFPEHSGWTGMISEMELVATDHYRIKTGSRVRVKASVETPEYGWGDVTKDSTGIVKAVDGDELTVDFPEHSDWTGMISEMELVPNDTGTCLNS